MNFKKIVCIGLSSLFCNVTFSGRRTNALFGNAHYNLGKIITEKSDISLSESEKEAFLSGMVYADIGRFKFDKETGIDSDSYEFANKMKELAESDEEKWFSRGFEVHAFQDEKTQELLKDIIGCGYSSYADYMTHCGILDSHFSKKTGGICNEFLNKFNFEQVTSGWSSEDLSKLSGMPKDKIKIFAGGILDKYSKSRSKKNTLVLYDDLIKKTYKSLGYEVSLDDIHEQAGNIVGVFAIASTIIGNKKEIPKELALQIEKKCSELANLCISKFEITKPNKK